MARMATTPPATRGEDAENQALAGVVVLMASCRNRNLMPHLRS